MRKYTSLKVCRPWRYAGLAGKVSSLSQQKLAYERRYVTRIVESCSSGRKHSNADRMIADFELAVAPLAAEIAAMLCEVAEFFVFAPALKERVARVLADALESQFLC